MGKTSLSDAQINRVNELAYDIWDLLLGTDPDRHPGFVRDASQKAEYGVKDAVSRALRAIYLPDSPYGGDFLELMDFITGEFMAMRPQGADAAASRKGLNTLGSLSSIFYSICSMAAGKQMRPQKK